MVRISTPPILFLRSPGKRWASRMERPGNKEREVEGKRMKPEKELGMVDSQWS